MPPRYRLACGFSRCPRCAIEHQPASAGGVGRESGNLDFSEVHTDWSQKK